MKNTAKKIFVLSLIFALFLQLFLPAIIFAADVEPKPSGGTDSPGGGSGLSDLIPGGGCFSGKGLLSRIRSFGGRVFGGKDKQPENVSETNFDVSELEAAAEEENAANAIKEQAFDFIQDKVKLGSRAAGFASGITGISASSASRAAKNATSKAAGALIDNLPIPGGKVIKGALGKIPGIGGFLGGGPQETKEVDGPLLDLTKNFLEVQKEILKKQEEARRIAKTECVKSHIYDSIAWFVAKRVIHSFTTSIVGWISGEGKSDPKFVVNTPEFWRDVANEASGLVIEELGVADLLCKPFKFQLQFDLKFRQRPLDTRLRCTADDVVDNFRDSFAYGGWKSWLKLTTNPQNYYSGAYLASIDEIERRRAEAIEAAKTDQEANGNFLGVRVCTRSSGQGRCARWETRTPGKTVSDLLSRALGSDISQLELADEFNEIAVALVNRMRGWLVTGGGGNRGLLKFDGKIENIGSSVAGEGGGIDGESGAGGSGSSIIGGEPNTSSPVETKREEILSRFDAYITREIAYRDAKQKTLDLILDKESSFTDLKLCYQGQFFINRQRFSGKTSPTEAEKATFESEDERLSLVISNVNATTTEVFSPLADPVQNEIDLSQSIIDELLEGKSIARAVTLLEALNNVELNYLSSDLIRQVHDGFDVKKAEEELESLRKSLEEKSVSTEFNKCLADLETLNKK